MWIYSHSVGSLIFQYSFPSLYSAAVKKSDQLVGIVTYYDFVNRKSWMP